MRYQFLRFHEGKAKAVTLSYDDGVRDDLRFSDIISKAGLKCTFNLNNNIGKQGRVTEEEVKTYFLERGHEIAVHGALHRAPGYQRPIEGIRDVLDCRLELEQRFGRIVRGMAYPDSGIRFFENQAEYKTIKEYLKNLDIAYARTLGGDNNLFRLPTDWHAWMPTAHHNNPNLMDYIDEFVNLNPSKGYSSTHFSRLFYLWGHTYEFERDQNWDLLEQICETLGGLDDVWYATNMEIYEYVKAYESLVYSADGKTAYNPTLQTVWMEVDGTLYTIPSGETIRIKENQ